MYSSAVFTGVDLFALKFYLDKVVPHQPFLPPENKRYWLPDDEYHIPLRSLVLTQYRSVTDVQTDGFGVAYTARAKLDLRRAVKTKMTPMSMTNQKEKHFAISGFASVK